MADKIGQVKTGLALVILCLIFGVGMGISFGVYEDGYKTYIADEVAANPQVHDAKSNGKIWRYAQRAHFHATGISGFALGLIILIMLSDMKGTIKRISAILVGLSICYPLSWFTMFLLSPGMGREAAHHYFLTEAFTYIGVGGLLSGILLLLMNVFLGLLREDA